MENGNTDDDEPAIPWLSQPVWGHMFALIIVVPNKHLFNKRWVKVSEVHAKSSMLWTRLRAPMAAKRHR